MNTPDWEPPDDWLRITTIDAHTAGEPLRIVTGGWPELPGDTILARRQFAREHCEPLRRALMWEPRGHADMYGCIPMPPATEDGDVGVLFLHNEGYSTMCGHAIIGLVQVGVETGMFAVRGNPTTVRIDTPAGRVTARAWLADGDGPRVEQVTFRNVPSFLLERDIELDLAGLGRVRCDIGYGGAFYAYVDAPSVGAVLAPEHTDHLIDLGMRIKRAVVERYEIVHPDGDDDLNFLYGTILVQRLEGPVHSRNVCVFADGEVDRSPTGTGVSGRAAVHHARGELEVDRWITIESLIGTPFDVRVADTCRVGKLDGIVPEVAGRASITGRHEFLIDPRDPLRAGFLLRGDATRGAQDAP